MNPDCRPQENSDPSTDDAQIAEVQCGEQAVTQHRPECPVDAGAAIAPGQQANPSAIKLMPAIRLITIPAPGMSAPNNRRTTIGGYTSKIKPVAAAPTTASAHSLTRRPRFRIPADIAAALQLSSIRLLSLNRMARPTYNRIRFSPPLMGGLSSSRPLAAENVDRSRRDDDDCQERDRAFEHHEQLGAGCQRHGIGGAERRCRGKGKV